MSWYEVKNVDEVASPALLVWPERVKANIATMIASVGGDVSRLRPHVKTHKLAEVVRLQVAEGITQFKCATIAEAEMTAQGGADDVLLAYQAVGPNIPRLIELAEKYPDCGFACLTDTPAVAAAIADAITAADAGNRVRVFVDIDCGMHRTGIEVGEQAAALCRQLHDSGVWGGLHVYDGHIHDPGLDNRQAAFDDAFTVFEQFVADLESDGLKPPSIVGGGSPTFGLHSAQKGWQCSPGTTLFWDDGYGTKFPDLEFVPATVLLGRIISKPGRNHVCIDLGHKSVSAENPIERRVRFLNFPESAKPVGQSEEHLVMEFPDDALAERECLQVGDVVYGMPWHICPTVALHQEAVVIEDGQATGERWTIHARNRRLTV